MWRRPALAYVFGRQLHQSAPPASVNTALTFVSTSWRAATMTSAMRPANQRIFNRRDAILVPEELGQDRHGGESFRLHAASRVARRHSPFVPETANAACVDFSVTQRFPCSHFLKPRIGQICFPAPNACTLLLRKRRRGSQFLVKELPAPSATKKREQLFAAPRSSFADGDQSAPRRKPATALDVRTNQLVRSRRRLV